MRFRAEWRAHWLSIVGVALLVGVAGGVVLVAVAGARRTETTLARVGAFRADPRRDGQSRRKRRVAGISPPRMPRLIGCRASSVSLSFDSARGGSGPPGRQPRLQRSPQRDRPGAGRGLSGVLSIGHTSSRGETQTRSEPTRSSSTKRRRVTHIFVPAITCVWRSSTPQTFTGAPNRHRSSLLLSPSLGSAPDSTTRVEHPTIPTCSRR